MTHDENTLWILLPIVRSLTHGTDPFGVSYIKSTQEMGRVGRILPTLYKDNWEEFYHDMFTSKELNRKVYIKHFTHYYHTLVEIKTLKVCNLGF